MSLDEQFEQIRNEGLSALGIYVGKYRAQVVDNADPDKLGRLKLKVPQVWGDEKHDYWAWPESPALGQVFLPAIGDMVWVEFEMGNPDYPIWTGVCWYKGKIPSEVTNNYIALKIIKSLAGNKIEFDDTTGDEKLTITSKQGHIINMFKDGITIQDSVGSTIKFTSGGITIDTPSTVCKFNGGSIPINNLPSCLFSGAPHGSNPKNLG